MKCIFLSDAHLKSERDKGYRDMMRFLDSLGAEKPDQLFVAGDFFDFWFGRGDHVYPDFKPVIEKLMVLRDAGTLIRLCEGNHDFFLGDYFAAIPGITVCRESAVVDLEGRKTLVAHGDLVDREKQGIPAASEDPEKRPVLSGAAEHSPPGPLDAGADQLQHEPGTLPAEGGRTGAENARIRHGPLQGGIRQRHPRSFPQTSSKRVRPGGRKKNVRDAGGLDAAQLLPFLPGWRFPSSLL